MTMLTVEEIARTAHEVNRAYCQSIGDMSIPTWANAPDWMKEAAIDGVKFHLEMERQPRESHENWLRKKTKDGWSYGSHKDPDRKTHPCMVPYEELPPEQQTKDYLFKAVVDNLIFHLEER